MEVDFDLIDRVVNYLRTRNIAFHLMESVNDDSLSNRNINDIISERNVFTYKECEAVKMLGIIEKKVCFIASSITYKYTDDWETKLREVKINCIIDEL